MAWARYMLWPGVCVSHDGIVSKGWTDWADFRLNPRRTYIVIKEIRVSPKIRVLPSGTFTKTLLCWFFCLLRRGTSTVASAVNSAVASSSHQESTSVYNTLTVKHSLARSVCGSWDLYSPRFIEHEFWFFKAKWLQCTGSVDKFSHIFSQFHITRKSGHLFRPVTFNRPADIA